MSVKQTILKYHQQIKQIGIGNDPKINLMLALMNQIAVTGGVISFIVMGIGFTIGLNIIYGILAFVLGSCGWLILVLNHWNKFHISRFIIAGVLPCLVSTFVLLIGGSFGEEIILTVLLFLIYIFYEEEPQKRVWFYGIMGGYFIASSVYLFFYPPIIKVINNPYDNLLAAIFCVIWLVMIIRMFQRKITEQQKSQEKLIQEMRLKNLHLQKTTEELEQFTYIASHDLKSPLRTIISFLDLIKRDVNRQRYDDLLSKLDFARSGAEQMNFLVTDILEYSKITNGKAKKKTMVNLASVAEKVQFNLMDLIEKRKVDLYIFPLPEFYCNETEMTVLFQNFIENGIKYNKENTPTIFVKSQLDEQQLTLQFIDNGIGIEETYFEKIFLLFKRLHTTEVYKGTGLGLGLCKKIIDDMGGTVHVESTLNVGSTFTIILPLNATQKHASKTLNLIETA